MNKLDKAIIAMNNWMESSRKLIAYSIDGDDGYCYIVLHHDSGMLHEHGDTPFKAVKALKKAYKELPKGNRNG